jgi:TusA-related sulfurtransferase
MPENDSKTHERSERFQSIPQGDVPKGRDGKHKQIILEVLESLEELRQGAALKIALDELPDTKENIRAALSRATKQRKMDVATSSDDKHLYIWKVDQ